MIFLVDAVQLLKEGREGAEKLPQEQLLPGMQDVSVPFKETEYRGGDECEGSQRKAGRQALVSSPCMDQ